MKQLLIMILALSLGVVANAQPKIRGNSGHVRPRVIVTAPVYPLYGRGFGYGFGYRYSPFYSPLNDPFYRSRAYRYESVPSQLRLEIDDINNDYDYRISEVRRHKSLPGKERREQIRELKHQREGAIIDAKRAFYKNER